MSRHGHGGSGHQLSLAGPESGSLGTRLPAVLSGSQGWPESVGL
jgi:hypothetical protein